MPWSALPTGQPTLELAPGNPVPQSRGRQLQHKCFGMFGAQERTRTSTTLRPLAPEASASASSATWAQARKFTAASNFLPAPLSLSINPRLEQADRDSLEARLVRTSAAETSRCAAGARQTPGQTLATKMTLRAWPCARAQRTLSRIPPER